MPTMMRPSCWFRAWRSLRSSVARMTPLANSSWPNQAVAAEPGLVTLAVSTGMWASVAWRMGVTHTSVANAMSLSLFMVNLSGYLLGSLRTRFAGAGISDLKSWYRGRHYASALLKMLPQNPDAIICEQMMEQICQLGLIHLPSDRAPQQQMAA